MIPASSSPSNSASPNDVHRARSSVRRGLEGGFLLALQGRGSAVDDKLTKGGWRGNVAVKGRREGESEGNAVHQISPPTQRGNLTNEQASQTLTAVILVSLFTTNTARHQPRHSFAGWALGLSSPSVPSNGGRRLAFLISTELRSVNVTLRDDALTKT